MKPVKNLAAALSLAVGAWFPLTASAQTLTITNGIQIYGALTNTTVTMTGRCELWVTDSIAPLSGCTVNLNTVDSWLFIPNVLPSVVASTYLGQVRVNGASAVADSNVRVVQYAMGAVVIPHSSSFQPMQVFNGAQFTGASLQLNQYTLYTGTALGVLDRAISSFKLKRGYVAVVAQNVNGTGVSRCYIAQDGDLAVSVLPSSLDNQIRFIRVMPWRWTSKKGISGNPGLGLLNLRWWYDWNIDQSSSRDLEYVAIRQNQSWPGLGQNWQSLGVNTVLGYNEPDQANQANMSVSTAISSWPDLLGTGLRVGAPAVSDGGRSSWLYPFMTQADAAGLRVDFVPVHYYQAHNPADPSGAASQMYSFLLDIWNHTHRPVWVTEWNNGANWTDNNPWPAPTYAQQQACIAAMVAMLDSTPFVERYALYNWVEDVRSVVTNNILTAAGVTYSNEISPISYLQTTPDVGSRGIAQLLFETNSLDSSGYGNNGFAFGSPGYTAGHRGQAIVLDGTNNFIQLPTTVAQSNAFSFAAWVYWNGGPNWQRIFDFGSDTSHYLFLTPSSGGGTLRFAINNGSGEQIVETAGLASGQWTHVALTLAGGNAKIYTNGVLAASSGSITIVPANFNPNLNYLGKSQFSADPLFNGSLDEVQIADYAFTAAQIAALQTNSPPQFTTNLMTRGTATEAVAYSNNIIGTATDPDPGDTLTYSKAGGPAWLSVSTNGILTGTPTASDGGTNYFTMRVTDAAGASAFAVVTISTTVISVSGAWSADASGNWSDATKWSGGVVANAAGYTADFSMVNITADRTVTLDSSRSIGTLKFSDTSGAQNWSLNSSGGSILTLDTGSSALPSIVVTNTATISVPLAGVNGFALAGSGTLILSNANTFTGNARILSGTLKIAHTNALQAGTVSLDDGDGALTFGPITSANLGGLTGTRNIVLTNSANVGVALNLGGSGNNSYAGILSGSGSLVNSGSGTFTLTSSNTYTGGTIINAGTVKLSRDPVIRFAFNNAAGSSGGSVITNTGTGGAAMNGTIVGTGASVVSGGRYGNALTNTGTGGTAATNIVLVNSKGIATDATGTWTLGYWIKTTTAGAVIMYQGDGTWSSAGQTAYLLNANSGSTAGTTAGAVRWGGGFLTGTIALNNGNWHFITLVDRAGTETIYVDGHADTVTSTVGLALSSLANQMWIGGSPDADAGAFKINGLIDEVYLYNRALNLAEIQLLTNNTPNLTVGNFGGQLPAATALAVSAGATFDFGGNSQTIASLAGNFGGGTITNSGAAPVTLTFGGGSGTNTFSGIIADNAATNAISLVKNGAAMEILSGANNFRGATTVNNGSLIVNGSLGTNSLTVTGGQLGGNGVIAGSLLVQSGGTLTPGGSIGVLTCSNNVTLQSGSTNFFELNKISGTNDQLRVSGALNYGGTLFVTNLSGTLAGSDRFQLFSAVNFSGNFSVLAGSPGAGLDWKFNPTNGVLTVYSTVPANLTVAVTNAALQISWPADHLGWMLQVQTNDLSAGLGTNWISIPGSTTNTQFVAPLVPENPSVFYRLIYQ
jgi:autotransporter-associated beta strand protein